MNEQLPIEIDVDVDVNAMEEPVEEIEAEKPIKKTN
jgi:hypothetical protein